MLLNAFTKLSIDDVYRKYQSSLFDDIRVLYGLGASKSKYQTKLLLVLDCSFILWNESSHDCSVYLKFCFEECKITGSAYEKYFSNPLFLEFHLLVDIGISNLKTCVSNFY